MKLKLERVRDISILVISGELDAQNLLVLKAGIKKLFSEGKNKIILELPECAGLTPDILRELSHMNLLAMELAGQIVFSEISKPVREKIESFTKPPFVLSFETRAQALESFAPKPAVSKDEIKEQELGDVGKLRRENESLRHDNERLLGAMEGLWNVRKEPPDLEGWRERTAVLEGQLEKALEAATPSKPAAKP